MGFRLRCPRKLISLRCPHKLINLQCLQKLFSLRCPRKLIYYFQFSVINSKFGIHHAKLKIADGYIMTGVNLNYNYYRTHQQRQLIPWKLVRPATGCKIYLLRAFMVLFPISSLSRSHDMTQFRRQKAIHQFKCRKSI